MRRLGLVIPVLVIYVLCWEARPSLALTPGEVLALNDTLAHFPLLAQIPWKLAKSRQPYLGKPWTPQSLATACDGGQGWSLFGIHCSASKNIDGIYMYVVPQLYATLFSTKLTPSTDLNN